MITTRHLNIASSFCEKLHVNTPQIPQLMANILHHTKNVNSQRWNLSDLYFILVYVSIYQNTVQCILIVIFLFLYSLEQAGTRISFGSVFIIEENQVDLISQKDKPCLPNLIQLY